MVACGAPYVYPTLLHPYILSLGWHRDALSLFKALALIEEWASFDRKRTGAATQGQQLRVRCTTLSEEPGRRPLMPPTSSWTGADSWELFKIQGGFSLALGYAFYAKCSFWQHVLLPFRQRFQRGWPDRDAEPGHQSCVCVCIHMYCIMVLLTNECAGSGDVVVWGDPLFGLLVFVWACVCVAIPAVPVIIYLAFC